MRLHPQLFSNTDFRESILGGWPWSITGQGNSCHFQGTVHQFSKFGWIHSGWDPRTASGNGLEINARYLHRRIRSNICSNSPGEVCVSSAWEFFFPSLSCFKCGTIYQRQHEQLRQLPTIKTGSTFQVPSLHVETSPDDVAKYLSRCHELYTWQRHERPATKGGASNTFVLQDGPPYANGDLHVGHALNKVIKDVICRAKVAQGMRVEFVPGSDCHGLPVELKALDTLSPQQQKNIDDDALKIRSKAKSYVQDMIKRHIRGFQSWGLMADWDNHWKTMDRDFELRQLRVFQTIAKHGLIFRSNRPVYWSPSTHTALAEAELEYQDDYISTAAFIKLPLDATLGGKPLCAAIWTAEPWTLPANQAIAINRELKYVIVHSKKHGNLVVAEARLSFLQENFQEDLDMVEEVPSRILTEYKYSCLPQFNDRPQTRSIIHADFARATKGTGLVHCAPGHSLDAHQALQSQIHASTVQVKVPVDDFGRFTEAACPSDPALLYGQFCFEEGNENVLKLLKQEGLLLASYKFRHRHPIDWRSGKPVMVRAISQWFLNISEIKSDILAALDEVQFQPCSGKARLLSFVGNRSDWCISRQRSQLSSLFLEACQSFNDCQFKLFFFEWLSDWQALVNTRPVVIGISFFIAFSSSLFSCAISMHLMIVVVVVNHDWQSIYYHSLYLFSAINIILTTFSKCYTLRACVEALALLPYWTLSK